MDLAVPSFSVSVLARVWLDTETFELICSRPSGFQFLAGQHVSFLLQGEERDYTILSPPDAPELRFLIKQITGGIVSSTLASIALGSILGISRARGYLTFRPTERIVYFVATGVGIAPFVAIGASGVRGFTLIHGVRTRSGLFYRQELSAAALCYIPCISGDDKTDGGLSHLYRGYVTEYLKTNLQPGIYDFYLCGSIAMIRDMTHLLDEHSSDVRIYSEAFN